MSGRYPAIVSTEEGMRDGMQLEDANIPIDAKVALLDALMPALALISWAIFPSRR